MSKLKITKEQYNAILLHEQTTRLNANRATIIESTTHRPELLNEAWKDVVLGVAMLCGVNLTGQNKEIADNAVKDPTIMAEIKATLEDEVKISELIDSLLEKGMKAPDKMLSVNPESMVYDFNKTAKSNSIDTTIGIKAALNLNSIAK
jgi:hypothetical protein